MYGGRLRVPGRVAQFSYRSLLSSPMITNRPISGYHENGHCFNQPPRIIQRRSNSFGSPSIRSPWPVTVTFGSRLAAPGAHRSRSIVRSGILHFLHLIVRHPSMLRSIELPPWKIENRSTTMRTIGGSPERIINYFVTFSAMPFD